MTTPQQPDDANLPQPDDIAMDDEPSPELLEHLADLSHHEEAE